MIAPGIQTDIPQSEIVDFALGLEARLNARRVLRAQHIRAAQRGWQTRKGTW